MDRQPSLHARGPSVTGRSFTATGIFAALGGLALMSLCCLAPGLIVALGIGSLYGALYGYRYVFVGIGLALIAVGLFRARRKRNLGTCACEEGGQSNAGT